MNSGECSELILNIRAYEYSKFKYSHHPIFVATLAIIIIYSVVLVATSDLFIVLQDNNNNNNNNNEKIIRSSIVKSK